MATQSTSRYRARLVAASLLILATAGCDYQKHYGLTQFHGVPVPALQSNPPQHADTQFWDKRAAHDSAVSGSDK